VLQYLKNFLILVMIARVMNTATIIIIIIIVTIVIITMTVISTRALRILMRRIFAIIMETLTSNLVMQNVSMRNL
jgi:hypothetical protein